jgi:hypothetical protein
VPALHAVELRGYAGYLGPELQPQGGHAGLGRIALPPSISYGNLKRLYELQGEIKKGMR